MIVCCNGDGDTKDKYLTVYMSSLKGRYDTFLGWPLNCTVNCHIVAADYLKISVNSQARVLDDCGFSSYACSSTLVSDNLYRFDLGLLKNLRDDCLFIQVCSVAF